MNYDVHDDQAIYYQYSSVSLSQFCSWWYQPLVDNPSSIIMIHDDHFVIPSIGWSCSIQLDDNNNNNNNSINNNNNDNNNNRNNNADDNEYDDYHSSSSLDDNH